MKVFIIRLLGSSKRVPLWDNAPKRFPSRIDTVSAASTCYVSTAVFLYTLKVIVGRALELSIPYSKVAPVCCRILELRQSREVARSS